MHIRTSVIIAPFLLVAALGALAQCQAQPLPTAADAEAFAAKVAVPPTRPFYMGFTPWPYDFDDAAINYTDQTIKDHGDLVLFHLDNGVPWPEALSGQPFPKAMQTDLDHMKATSSGRKVYVSASPLAHNRTDLALYWSTDTHQPLPSNWKSLAIDDPQVVRAYSQYCKRLIEFFQPDYFAYAIEVNGGLNTKHKNWPRLLKLVDAVYLELKKTYPQKTIFLSLQTGTFETTWDDQWEMNKELVKRTDLIGVSTYPLVVPGKLNPTDANVDYIPANWFSQMRTLAPAKPWAITETGYVAENIRFVGKNLRGTELWQARYVDLLLKQANALQAEFVAWFVVRDYDRGMQTLQKMGSVAAAAFVWKDMGLIEGEGRSRAGLKIWDAWRKVPVKK